MSAKHALLGLLLDRPAYPYQLADRLAQRLGPAWNVNSGQLYQTVKALEKDELIKRVDGVSADHSERHVFEITEEGVLEFENFFDQGSEAVRLSRRPLLVKLTFAGPQQLQQALAKIDAYEQECVKQLAEIAHIRDELPGDGPLVRADHLLLRLNLSADIFQLEGELRWATHARELLSWLTDNEALWPGKRSDAGAQPKRDDRGSARKELFGRMAGSERGDGSAQASARKARSE
jgi:DNA-binding PadR family transcriptional regulator